MHRTETMRSDLEVLKFLTDEDLLKIEDHIEIRTYKKGDTIFELGAPATEMYVLIQGFMKIISLLSDGKEQIMYIFKSGDFVGGLNLLSDDEYVYEGIALKECRILVIKRQAFEEVLMKNHAFLMHLLEMSYARIRHSESLIDRLSIINADMKVAKALINLTKEYGIVEGKEVLLNLQMSREELGSYTGISRETMSRKLHYFESLGIIQLLPKGNIRILDMKKLSSHTL